MLLTLIVSLLFQVESQDTLKTKVLDEIVINSVRAERLIPVTEQTLQIKALETNYSGQELPSFLSKTPSTTWYSEAGGANGYTYMRLRGIDQTRINFTMNGVPLNEPEDQGAYFSNYQDILNSIKSLQIQRGVGTSSYGTTSFGGSVNLETPSLRDPKRIEQQISYGSFNTYRISSEMNSGVINNHFSLYGRFSQIGSDGFRHNSGTLGKSFFLSGGYFDDKNMVKFVSFVGNSKNQMSYLAAAKGDLEKDYRSNYLSKDEDDNFTQSFSNIQYTRILSSSSTLLVSGYYNRLIGMYGVLIPPDLLNFSLKSNFSGVIVNHQYEKNGLQFNSGLHANMYDRNHTMQIAPDLNFNIYSNTGFKKEFSVFEKVTYSTGRFTTYGDLQIRLVNFKYVPDATVQETFTPINWTFINPKVGTTYSLTNAKSIYTSLGRTSREPTRNDMFAGYDNIDGTNYSEVGDFSRVKPETVTDFELGYKSSGKNFIFDANIYLMYFKNEIAAIGQLSYIGLPLRKNVASSNRKGVELVATGKLASNLTSLTCANFSHNRITEYTTDYDGATYKNLQPLLTPEVIVSQGLVYEPKTWISFEANAKYISQSFLDNTNNSDFVTPQSLIVNGAVNLISKKYLSLNFMANNIFNTKYYMSGYVVGSESYYFPMARRNFSITLKFKL